MEVFSSACGAHGDLRFPQTPNALSSFTLSKISFSSPVKTEPKNLNHPSKNTKAPSAYSLAEQSAQRWWAPKGDIRPAPAAPDPKVRGPPSAPLMVGRGGLEPPTSRLSGVRSNHLSYRPPHQHAVLSKTAPRTLSQEPQKDGGARRDRTDDLLNANQALSQLSYGPKPSLKPHTGEAPA